MKTCLFAAVIALAFVGCARKMPLEADPCDASRFEGEWQNLDDNPYWHYEFNYPHLRQWAEIGGTVISEHAYIYGTKGDTLWASGKGGNIKWVVCFPNDSTADYRAWHIKWLGAATLHRLK